MPWSDPDKGNDYNPWGRRTPPKSNNDFSALVDRLRKRLGGMFGNGGDNFNIGGSLPYLIGILLALWLASGIYVVGPDQQGVVLRFGAYQGTEPPGLHYHLPYPIETVYTPKVTESRRIEIGVTGLGGKGQNAEGLMLTRDENIVDINFAVQYRISNPVEYLFDVKEPEALVRQVAESAIREVVGRSLVDDVLTEGRTGIEQQTQDVMQRTLNRYNAGVTVDVVRLQQVHPPEPVLPAFLDVVSAREDLQRARNEAQAYANDVIPRARGQAARLLEEALAYKQRIIDQSLGDAARFRQIAAEYRKAPAVTRERLYIETMEDVLSNANKIFVDTRKGNNMLYLPLDKLMNQEAKAAAASKGGSQAKSKETPAPDNANPAGTGGASSSFELKKPGEK